MLSLIYNYNDDKNVYPFQVGMAFMLKREKIQKYYDFAKIIAEKMLEQLRNYNTKCKFRYSSFLVHLILHQNFEFLKRYLSLFRFDVKWSY